MTDVDYVIVGGGFYGCSLALFLRSVSRNVVLIEAEPHLMSRASAVNQARIHTGFHYPRNALTAVKSLALHKRFAADFPEAVVDDFEMLYAIANRRSKVNAARFHRMFASMSAPIALANPIQAAMFDPALIEAVFACREQAFDAGILRSLMEAKLAASGVQIVTGKRVLQCRDGDHSAEVILEGGDSISARYMFNTTYSQINHILRSAELPLARVKYELAEIALIEMSPALKQYGFTVMDGPFFSSMPYPLAGMHSLTHVRYTPHRSWTDGRNEDVQPNKVTNQGDTRHRHMLMDAKRYLPALEDARWQRSIYEVKTILLKNERDDGRPILLQRLPPQSRILSVMGGKIDNIYDLFDMLKRSNAEWHSAHDGWIVSDGRRQVE